MVLVLLLDSLKKLLGLLLVFAVPFCFYACGKKVDHTWVLKFAGATVPEGVYKYYLRESYNKASDVIVESGGSPENLSDQKICGVSFNEWVKTDAVNSCKDLLALEKMFKDENLSLTDKEKSDIESSAETVFSSLEQDFKKLSVSKEDVKRAYAECKAKYKKLFGFFYEKGGKEEVTNEKLIEYYRQEYVNYSMLTKYVAISGNSDDVQLQKDTRANQAQIKNAQEQIKEYVDLLNSGKKNIAQIAGMFKEKEQLSIDPIETETICLKNADVSEEVLNKLKDLEVGKADYVRINDAFILLFKNDISKKLPDLSNNEIREDILKSMKVDEFYGKIESVKNKMKIDINSNLMEELVPVKIFKDT